MYTIEAINAIIKGRILNKCQHNVDITQLVYDSRSISVPQQSLFFALVSSHRDGHMFLQDAYDKGVRVFIISETLNHNWSDASVIMVSDTLQALQQIAAYHRKLFDLPVIGITGSNGKTIVKEWLYQMLENDYKIVRSPKSYNSQIGVPLSVWQINKEHTLGLFEAGISRVGEMESLAQIIQPTVGVLTNIGTAHDEGFTSHEQKLLEKGKLFGQAEVVIGPYKWLNKLPAEKVITWGVEEAASFQIENISRAEQTIIDAYWKERKLRFYFQFTDDASIENVVSCICVLLYLGYEADVINERLLRLHPVDMRLQLKHGANQCTIINDSYSADVTSLQLALNFMQQQRTAKKKAVILSDFVETGKQPNELYRSIAQALVQAGVEKALLVGKEINEHLPGELPSSIKVLSFRTTDDLLSQFRASMFHNETILVKGARQFKFERIVHAMETKVHQTILEINLNALTHNLKQYKSLLDPATKIMAMVKAFSYGSGSSEIASILQFNHVDYLGVAYADEGIELRQAGITIPIMVMNVDASSFSALTEYNLQPVIYSFPLLNQFEAYLKTQGLIDYPVHIEIETGMHRLGFELIEVEALARHLSQTTCLKVQSVFSHLATSEDPAQDDFTKEQATHFQWAASIIQQSLSYSFLKHISNSAAIIRHPQLQFNMVRLGIGLYGIEIETRQLELQAVATLRSTIAQLKYLKAGETVSYNRRGVAKEDSIIATLRIGYADGYSRRMGNGVGKMWVNGHLAPVIGTVCMDMTMLDVTHIAGVEEGDEVIVFGSELPLREVAHWAGTIPYEIMTSVSQRVKRVYFQE